jgi:pilus assembly protein Flp/PilA
MGMTMRELIKTSSFVIGQAKRFAGDESGATAVEYAMIASGIAVAIVAAVMSLGTATTNMYNNVSTAMK